MAKSKMKWKLSPTGDLNKGCTSYTVKYDNPNYKDDQKGPQIRSSLHLMLSDLCERIPITAAQSKVTALRFSKHFLGFQASRYPPIALD